MRVLIADDNDDSAESMAMYMRMSGHEVTTVSDGAAALLSVQTARPDLILLDIRLPDTDGYALCSKLRADGYTGQLIAVTGYNSAEDIARSAQAGFDRHMVKPVDLALLDQIVGS